MHGVQFHSRESQATANIRHQTYERAVLRRSEHWSVGNKTASLSPAQMQDIAEVVFVGIESVDRSISKQTDQTIACSSVTPPY